MISAIGVIVILLGLALEVIKSLTHSHNYWAAFRHRWGFSLLVGTILAAIAWLNGNITLVLITLIGITVIAYGGKFLFESRHRKVPDTYMFGASEFVLILIGIAITLAPLYLSS